MIRWETWERGVHYFHSAWVVCIACGFSLNIDVPGKLKRYRLDDTFELANRLKCPCCEKHHGRIVTLRQTSQWDERWRVLTRSEEKPPAPPPPDRLKFVIERQRDCILGQVCGRLDNDVTSRAAFGAEVERHPEFPLILRLGGQVLATHKWPVGK